MTGLPNRRSEIESLADAAEVLRVLSDMGELTQTQFLRQRAHLVSELHRHRQELKHVDPQLSSDARRILHRVPPELTREQAITLASVRKRAEEYLTRSHTRDQAGKDGLLKQLDKVIGFLKPAIDAFPETKAMEKYRGLISAVEIREAPPETDHPVRRMQVLSGGLPGQGKRR